MKGRVVVVGANEVMAGGEVGDDEIGAVGQALEAAGVDGMRVFATSGSGGYPKWVCLSEAAVACSATAVNRHLGVGADDVWVRVLPAHHVGGYAIGVRAALAGARVEAWDERWSAAAVCEWLAAVGGTIVPMVPTQVYDVVVAGLVCPERVRAVVVGGGALDDGLRVRAVELGWPVLRTYGFTEAGSQVATERAVGDCGMLVLPIWDVRRAEGGVLEVRGEALASGVVRWDGGRGLWRFEAIAGGAWWRTADVVDLAEGGDGRTLVTRVVRAGRVVKVLGELVDVEAVEGRLRELLPEAVRGRVVVVAAADMRAGATLIVVIEGGGELEAMVGEVVGRYNAVRPGPERLGRVVATGALPRSALGKVLYGELAGRLAAACGDGGRELS